jgi:hypothetical protein
VKQLKDHKSKDRFHYFSALNKAAQMMTLAGNYSEAEVGRQQGQDAGDQGALKATSLAGT